MIGEIAPPAKLIVQLLYGSGLRLLEALALRVKDVEFAQGQLTVRDPQWKHHRTRPAHDSPRLLSVRVSAAPQGTRKPDVDRDRLAPSPDDCAVSVDAEIGPADGDGADLRSKAPSRS